ncbi:MAG: lamin tail domain-containing protein [Deltaproteobacteria bacterium]|nr:lamin tail domain-containing protein [Deltaproteobacteria bacterium]
MSWLFLLTPLAFAAEPPPGGWPVPPAQSVVASVYDGDTVTLASGDKVRLRWVNTPELRPAEAYGVEAREAAKEFVSGKEVRLLLGSENPRDDYGRVVSGLETDEGNLSIHLLELGLGHLFVIPPDDTDLVPFLEAQGRAQAANRGIWSTERYQGALHITSFHANAPGDDRQNVNGEYLRVTNVTAEPVNLDGFTIADRTGRSWTLPSLIVPAGHTVKLHSGVGGNQVSPDQQLTVHLGSNSPIWNNKYDRATLYDRFGRVVDAREHSVQKETP